MAYLIDRRLNGKNKSAVNRQRFLRRYRKHIKEAVADAVSNRSITDIDSGETITIPKGDIEEPAFGHGPGGKRSVIHPGNKEFVKGDQIERPKKGGAGGGGGKASNKGEGMDDFAFQITQEEFLNFMFDELELPNLVKRQLAGTDTFKYRRAGFSTVGTPSQINIVRSLKAASGRRIALGASKRRKLRVLEQNLALEQAKVEPDEFKLLMLDEEIAELKSRLKRIPFLDDFDIRYNMNVKEPQPTSKAVMFCVMDVSGSMTQDVKDMAKRFFILLYLFLQRNYDRTDVVFIRHHTSAKEVDEEEFFYSRETGGTVVSSALKLMNTIMQARYPASEWNIYGAQASDGDNWKDDSSSCFNLLVNDIMPKMQHYSYVEITPNKHQALWYEYEQVKIQFEESFALQQISNPGDIFPVFRELFQRRPA